MKGKSKERHSRNRRNYYVAKALNDITGAGVMNLFRDAVGMSLLLSGGYADDKAHEKYRRKTEIKKRKEERRNRRK